MREVQALFALAAAFIPRYMCGNELGKTWSDQLLSWRKWSGIGFCRGNTSLLYPSFPHGLCHRRDCAWSISKQTYVTIDDKMDEIGKISSICSPLDHIHGLDSGRIRTDITASFSPEVSFVYVISKGRISTAVTSMIEVFRTSKEVSSFDFIVINYGCREDDEILTELIDKFRSHFAISVQYRKNYNEKGYSEVLQDALKMSTAKYIAIPSLDFLVAPGWLHALLHTIESHGDAGVVGTIALRRADGLIHSAGGTLHRFGMKPKLYHAGVHPSDGILFHVRHVDYLTASSTILFRREEYLQLSSSFSDMSSIESAIIDICLGFLYKSGQKSYLQPFALTIGPISSTTDDHLAPIITKGESDFSNSLRMHYRGLFSRYCPYICDNNSKVNDGTYSYLSQGTLRPHVLMVDNLMPELDRDSGSIRLYEILKILRIKLGLAVSLETIKVRDVRYMLPLMAMGINVMPPKTFRMLAEGVDSKGRNDTLSRLREKLRFTNALCPWDVIIIARYKVALYTLRYIRKICPKVPVIYDTVDVGFLRERRTFELEAKKHDAVLTEDQIRYLDKLKSNELKLMRYAKTTFVVSSYELELLQQFFPRKKNDIRILSNVYAKPVSRPTVTESMFGERSGLLFVGNMCHPPNVDAVTLLYQEIFKAVVESMPDETIDMHLVMSNLVTCSNADLMPRLEAHPRVKIHRDISDDDLFKLHQKVRLFVAPLRAGAGVKGKINYALWSGLPIVASKIASEGMGLIDQSSFLLADTSPQFVNAIKIAYTDFNVWQRLRHEGYAVHDKFFSESVAVSILNHTLLSISDKFSPHRRNQHTEYPKCRVFDGPSAVFVGRMQCLKTGHPSIVSVRNPFRRGYFMTNLN